MYSTSSLGQSLLTLLLATSVGCAVPPSSTPGVSAVAEPASGQARRANAETGRLAHWTFNDAGWHGERGQAPRRAENLQRVEGVEGSAVEFTNVQAVLTYRAIEANGSPNIGLEAGTVRFWYRPNWRSNAQYYDAGLGPRQRVRLLDLGTCALDINPNGDTLIFQSADGQGAVRTNVQTRFYWPLTNWNEIILRYSPTESSLILNGNPPARGPGIEALSPSSAQDQGFALGGSADGALRALGRIDEVETYGFPLGIAAIGTLGTRLRPRPWVRPLGLSCLASSKRTLAPRFAAALGWGPNGKLSPPMS